MRDPASAVSLAALLVAVAASGSRRVNAGVLALALAWLVSLFAGLPLERVTGLFPSGLFLTLLAVTLLFGIARINGTLAQLTGPLLRLACSRRRALPLTFFTLAAGLSTVGVGNIGTVALLAPLGLTVARDAGVGSFLMTLMIVSGANAGALSPLAFTGVIANGLIARQGLSMSPWADVFLPSSLTQGLIALAAYALFRHGIRAEAPIAHPVRTPWRRAQAATAALLLLFVMGVAVFKADVGFLGLTLSAILLLGGATSPKAALEAVAWDAVLMVSGMSLLVGTIEACGGLDLLSSGVARVATPETAAGTLALVAGASSIYSSSSGVVMPAMIPLVPGLIERMGGGDPVALVSAINVGSHVVDVSPLSTLGALCLASAAEEDEAKRKLFRSLLICGASMSLVGAGVCHVLFDRLR
jgi:Na+/H+ antiporter NhaD/arsenite permease-like protein